MPTPKFVFKRIALYVLLIFHFTKNSAWSKSRGRSSDSQLMAVVEHRVKEKS